TKLLLIAVLLCGKVRARQADDQARHIINQAIAAHGVVAKIRKLKVMQWGGMMKADLPGLGQVEGTWQQTWQLPSRVKDVQELKVNGMDLRKTQVFNGEQVWISENGQTRVVQGAERQVMQEEMYPETLDKLVPLTEPGYGCETIPEIQIAGRPAVGVKISAPGHRDVKLYFFKDSSLLAKRENQIRDETGKLVVLELFYSDYKNRDGLQLYHKAVAHLAGQKFEEFTITGIKFFDKLDDAVFAKP
ncbi:MAG: hypothetical protein JOZ57_11590, partial [Abitibacteriaceae bacterium]|nr:hypothetical protein [Abditibacteriaceae bacterium]